MREIYELVLVLHILGGGVGLLALPLPLLARKGRRLHAVSGWVFTVAMAVATVSGTAIALSWLVAAPVVKDLPNEASITAVRGFGLFFLLLSALAGTALLRGIVAVRRRKTAMPRSEAVLTILTRLTPVLGAVVTIVGFVLPSALLVAFGAFGVWFGVAELRQRPDGAQPWVVAHLDAMLGAATVVTTAFTVQMVGRLGGDTLGLWAWAVPVVLGNVAAYLWRRPILRRR